MTFSLKFILQPQTPTGIQVIKRQLPRSQLATCNVVFQMKKLCLQYLRIICSISYKQ